MCEIQQINDMLQEYLPNDIHDIIIKYDNYKVYRENYQKVLDQLIKLNVFGFPKKDIRLSVEHNSNYPYRLKVDISLCEKIPKDKCPSCNRYLGHNLFYDLMRTRHRLDVCLMCTSRDFEPFIDNTKDEIYRKIIEFRDSNLQSDTFTIVGKHAVAAVYKYFRNHGRAPWFWECYNIIRDLDTGIYTVKFLMIRFDLYNTLPKKAVVHGVKTYKR